jgi:hypothetical protein
MQRTEDRRRRADWEPGTANWELLLNREPREHKREIIKIVTPDFDPGASIIDPSFGFPLPGARAATIMRRWTWR